MIARVPHRQDRRRLLAATAGAACAAVAARAQPRLRVAALFAGRIDDGGFMQAGFDGLQAARRTFGVEIGWKDRVVPERDRLVEALRELASAGPALVIAHGGQNDAAARIVAAAFQGVRFAVTQGSVVGPNLASYEVLQEESAFLAGALAGWTTASGVVGHMSGIRVAPGLKGRAAFAHGVSYAAPSAKLLTNFSGDQDDAALAKRVASAMVDARADIIFTMLNAGRRGAIELCRARGVKQIGNVGDWVAAAPDVFVASAIADSGVAVLRAVEDLVGGAPARDAVEKIGLARPEAVRLAMSSALPDGIRGRIGELAERIRSGAVAVPTTWSGPEFSNPT